MSTSVILVKLQPNQDLTEALESVVRERGYSSAKVLAAVGSLVEAVLNVDGEHVLIPNPGQEIAALSGQVNPTGGSRLSGYVCCADASVRAGAFARGLNSVGVTFEILLEGRIGTDP